MAYVEFEDEEGRGWRAWDTYPQNPHIVAPGFEKGWLSFETEGEKHRLAPIPPEWNQAPLARLREMLRVARSPHIP